ncbi:MAG: hypothetical protein HQ494_15765 [Rhodospirillales bacterium]|nr:hypothetical protein [Rhodospirillales bacterium]
MDGIEEFMESFGFTVEALTLFFICALILMVNFAGGLFSNIIVSFGGPIHDQGLTKRTSFRLALVSELFLIIYIAYYHTVLVPGIETAEIIFWGFIVLAAPLLAAIGAQLTYVAFAKKIDGLKKQGRQLERAQRDGERAQDRMDDDEDDD